jgi:hypothetical protein
MIRKLNRRLFSHYLSTIHGKEFSSAVCTLPRKDFNKLLESPVIKKQGDSSILFEQSAGLVFKIRVGGKFRVRYRGVR